MEFPVRRSAVRMIGWAMSAGIVLAVGIGIGRSSIGPGVPAPVAERPSDDDVPTRPLSARRVALEQLADVEPLLTMIGADARSGRFDPQVQAWARNQLTRTRLALDAEVGQDPAIRGLLQDLELILAQVVSLGDTGPRRTNEELTLIAQGMTEQGLLERIRTATATGP